MDAKKGLIAALGLELACFWPVFAWYGARLADGPDDRWGLLPPAAVALLAFRKGEPRRPRAVHWWVLSLLMLLYAVTFHLVPPLLRATLAAATLGLTLCFFFLRRSPRLGVCGLLALSLPVIPSLQFYLGYPMRALLAGVAAPLLRLSGFAVAREGACLDWAGRLIWVDAPCGGIRMLWTGFVAAFLLSCWFDLSSRRTILLCLVALVAVLVGNVLRTCSLFFLEAGVVAGPSWTHAAIGAMAFVATLSMIFGSVPRIRKADRCAPSPCS